MHVMWMATPSALACAGVGRGHSIKIMPGAWGSLWPPGFWYSAFNLEFKEGEKIPN